MENHVSSALRENFVSVFGEEQASLLEEACDTHISQKATDPLVRLVQEMLGDTPEDHRNDNRGSEPFQYVILAVLGFECVTKPGYASAHGITIDPYEFGNWVITQADLDSYDGDQPDHLRMAIVQLTRLQQEMGDIPE